MPRTIRFHLDENCAHSIAAGLRRRGIDVTTTRDAGLLGATDEYQLLTVWLRAASSSAMMTTYFGLLRAESSTPELSTANSASAASAILYVGLFLSGNALTQPM
jgi:hypothetical protein